jgi:lipoprotein NlpI
MSETTTRLLRSICVRSLLAAAIGLSAGGLAAQPPAADPAELMDAAVAAFEAGRIDAAVASFDRVAQLRPDVMPQLWQRGIALYYAGRFAECQQQFEAHRTVNPNDVENAAWHYLCVARGTSPARAREALLPVGPDARRPMREVYALYQGRLDGDAVIGAAGGDPAAVFYAHLYVGLYREATGDAAGARRALTIAAEDRFRAAGGYMHMVARVHVGRLAAR